MDYGKYILIAAPFMMSSFVMNNILRAQGNAMYSMIGITTGGVLNMILDPIPVSYTHLDVYKRQASEWLRPDEFKSVCDF